MEWYFRVERIGAVFWNGFWNETETRTTLSSGGERGNERMGEQENYKPNGDSWGEISKPICS